MTDKRPYKQIIQVGNTFRLIDYLSQDGLCVELSDEFTDELVASYEDAIRANQKMQQRLKLLYLDCQLQKKTKELTEKMQTCRDCIQSTS